MIRKGVCSRNSFKTPTSQQLYRPSKLSSVSGTLPSCRRKNVVNQCLEFDPDIQWNTEGGQPPLTSDLGLGAESTRRRCHSATCCDGVCLSHSTSVITCTLTDSSARSCYAGRCTGEVAVSLNSNSNSQLQEHAVRSTTCSTFAPLFVFVFLVTLYPRSGRWLKGHTAHTKPNIKSRMRQGRNDESARERRISLYKSDQPCNNNTHTLTRAQLQNYDPSKAAVSCLEVHAVMDNHQCFDAGQGCLVQRHFSVVSLGCPRWLGIKACRTSTIFERYLDRKKRAS